MTRVASGVVLLAACSSSDEGLFGGVGTPDASAGSAGSGAGIGGSAGSAGAAAQGGLDASGGSAGAPDAGGESGGGANGGAGAGGSAGAGAEGGTGGDEGIGTGPCNGPLCDFAGGESCCVADGKGALCISDNQWCTCNGALCNSVRIRCDGHEDCDGGDVCCAEYGFTSGQIDEIACRQSCQSDFVTRREMCDPEGAPCQNGHACVALTSLPPGYWACEL